MVIGIAAAGVNRADLMQRQGFYPPPPGAPPYPGLECSGRIAALGDGVDRLAAGRRGVRPARRRRLRGAGGRAAGPAAAGPGRRLADRRGGPAQAACTIQGTVYQQAHLDAGEVYLVHGGAGSRPPRGDRLGKADGAVGGLHAGHPGQQEALRARRRPGHLLPRPGFRGHHAGLHRRARGGRHPGRGGRPTWPGTWPRWPAWAGWW